MAASSCGVSAKLPYADCAAHPPGRHAYPAVRLVVSRRVNAPPDSPHPAAGGPGSPPTDGDVGPTTSADQTDDPSRGLVSRRAALAAGALAGVAGLVGGDGIRSLTESYAQRRPLPFYTGPAASIHAGRRTPPRHPVVQVTWSGSSSRPQACLTFDDGPLPRWTPQVLETLAAKDAVATFFVRGDHLSTHHALLEPYRSVHEFGNHTWDHRDLARLDYAACVAELTRTSDAMERLLGARPVLMRPPYGHLAGSTLLACNDLGLTPVLWSRQMLEYEYRNEPSGLAEYIAASVQPGDIILAHDTDKDDHAVAIQELGQIIDAIRGAGLDLVTVSQLLGL